MRGGVKLTLIFAFILAFIVPVRVVQATPAETAAIVAAINANGAANIAALYRSIYGQEAPLYVDPALRMVPSDTVPGAEETPLVTTPPRSLMHYFEGPYAARFIELEKANAAHRDKMEVAAVQNVTRHMDAQGYRTFHQKTKEMKTNTYASALLVDQVACPGSSMGQSTTAQIFIAKKEAEAMVAQAAEEMDGNANNRSYAKGPVQYAIDFIAKRRSEQLCGNQGNDRANEAWCPSGDAAKLNADIKATTLLGSWLLQGDKGSDGEYAAPSNNTQYAARYAQMFYKNNLFPDRSFTPIRKDLLNNLSPQAAEILTDRSAYAAQMSMFMFPFAEALAERTQTAGLASFQSLDAALNRAGITGEIKEKLIVSDKTSLAGSDFIRYKVYTHDPQTIISEAVPAAATNINAITVFMVERIMNQITLLYDIREEAKKTNMLLGAIGSVLSKQNYEDVQAKTQAIASTAN